jgi:hypothetical protein
MAGVLEQLIRPQKRAIVHRPSRADRKVLQLEAAKEIFEVSRVGIWAVEEMIQNRSAAHGEELRYEDEGLWPREFCLDG